MFKTGLKWMSESIGEWKKGKLIEMIIQILVCVKPYIENTENKMASCVSSRIWTLLEKILYTHIIMIKISWIMITIWNMTTEYSGKQDD